jgi:hypothetical protein
VRRGADTLQPALACQGYQQVTESINDSSNNSDGPVSDTQWGVSIYNPNASAVIVGTIKIAGVQHLGQLLSILWMATPTGRNSGWH